MYREDDRYDLEDRPLGKWIGLTVVLGVLGAFGFMMLRGQQSQSSRAEALVFPTAEAPAAAPLGVPATITTTTTTTTAAPATTATEAASDPSTPATTSTTAPTLAPVPAATTAPAAAAPATTGGAATTALAVTVATTAPATADLAYPAAPDGSPLPVIVTYDTGRVTLTGAVPSEDARTRLVGLARANSQQPGVAVVDNLFVNPAVPASVGVRVIEMDSPRFGEGEAQLLPEHTVQFDRVASVLEALPHVTVLVIGHADQRGDDQINRELSESRAGMVVDYLAYRGINPTRLSMRGAGETDLLTLDSDESALALNRRTEFIFYGVLV